MLITKTQTVKQFSDESEFESTLSFSLEKSHVEDWVVVENDAQELSLSLANWKKLVEMGNKVISNQKQKSFENAKHFFIKKIDKAIENSKSETVQENKLRQLFKNRSNCYADADDVIQAMDENCFVETINEWQQEQDKNLYSEEEVEVLIKTTYEETMRAMVDWFINNKDKNIDETESAIENYVYPRLSEKGIKFKKK
jgi:hypothetical protein